MRSLAQPDGDASARGAERTAGGQDADLTAGLTPRELEVLRLIAHGRTPREVSELLVISPKTVSSHLQRILAKLGVHSRLQAVARAYEAPSRRAGRIAAKHAAAAALLSSFCHPSSRVTGAVAESG